MTLPKSGKLYYALAGGSIVVAGGLLYLQNNSINDLREEAGQLRVKAEQQRGAKAKLMQEERDLGTLQAQLAHLEQGVPDHAYVPTMLRELEAFGKTYSVEVTGLKPSQKKNDTVAQGEKKSLESKPYEPLDLELKGKASYGDLLAFVSGLNTFPKILEVRTMSITPAPVGAGNTDRRLDLTIGIRAFLFKQPNPVKKEGLST